MHTHCNFFFSNSQPSYLNKYHTPILDSTRNTKKIDISTALKVLVLTGSVPEMAYKVSAVF